MIIFGFEIKYAGKGTRNHDTKSTNLLEKKKPPLPKENLCFNKLESILKSINNNVLHIPIDSNIKYYGPFDKLDLISDSISNIPSSRKYYCDYNNLNIHELYLEEVEFINEFGILDKISNLHTYLDIVDGFFISNPGIAILGFINYNKITITSLKLNLISVKFSGKIIYDINK